MSNVQILADAGLTKPEKLSDQDKKVIESLSPQEVNTLLQVKGKLGDGLLANHWQQPKFI
jgi:hypothetical protein